MQIIKVKAYPMATTIAEKSEVMVSRGIINSRLKGFYDLWLLSELFDHDYETIRLAVQPAGKAMIYGNIICDIEQRALRRRGGCRDAETFRNFGGLVVSPSSEKYPDLSTVSRRSIDKKFGGLMGKNRPKSDEKCHKMGRAPSP
jgi:hypothetical protein